MKPVKRNAGSDGSFGGASGGITRENYHERCAAFIRSRGGEGFVIREFNGPDGSRATGRPATQAQWIAWVYYFDHKEIPCTYLKHAGMGTVPCEWPEDFDYETLRSDKLAQLPIPPARASRERRTEIAHKMRALAASSANKDHRRKRSDVGAMSAVEAERHLAQLKSRYDADPCPMPASFVAPRHDAGAA